MALCAKAKSKKHSKKAVKNAKKSVLNAERAVEEFNRLAAYAGPLVTEGARDARDRAAALIAEYGPEVETRLRGYSETARNQAQAGSERLRSGSERLRTDGARFVGDVSERLGPNAVKLRDDVRNDYVPRAKRTVAVTNSVLSAATLAAIDAARKEFDKGQGQIRKAATTPVKPQRKNTVGKVLEQLQADVAVVGVQSCEHAPSVPYRPGARFLPHPSQDRRGPLSVGSQLGPG